MKAATKSQPHQTAELPRLRRNRHIAEETRCISADKEKIQQKEHKRNTQIIREKLEAAAEGHKEN